MGLDRFRPFLRGADDHLARAGGWPPCSAIYQRHVGFSGDVHSGCAVGVPSNLGKSSPMCPGVPIRRSGKRPHSCGPWSLGPPQSSAIGCRWPRHDGSFPRLIYNPVATAVLTSASSDVSPCSIITARAAHSLGAGVSKLLAITPPNWPSNEIGNGFSESMNSSRSWQWSRRNAERDSMSPRRSSTIGCSFARQCVLEVA